MVDENPNRRFHLNLPAVLRINDVLVCEEDKSWWAAGLFVFYERILLFWLHLFLEIKTFNASGWAGRGVLFDKV